MTTPINKEDLVIHILNVGFGDNIVIEFPVDDSDKRSYAIVDCYDADKTKDYLNKLFRMSPHQSNLAFICATHPHSDHISGIESLLLDSTFCPKEFWDSGFRHKSLTYRKILDALIDKNIDMIRVSSGMERYFGKVRVTVLSPSVVLRNKYDTYGIDMNNASVVLRLEHHDDEVLSMRSQEYEADKSLEAIRTAGKSVVILAGDAEFDSWAQISNEYPKLDRTSENDPLVKKMINYLACEVIKVAHHGSMHSSPLDIYEKMRPKLAVISAEQKISSKSIEGRTLKRGLFPHHSATIALEECDARIITTDGSYESEKGEDGNPRDASLSHSGSIVIVVPPGGKPRYMKLSDKKDEVPDPPNAI
ncbi:MAG: hypothetical protein JXB26_13285 [Candidatus Aminicenantes bacterium]|nr:hypothetical protein [Candidatus Aminicenantes bacterium]